MRVSEFVTLSGGRVLTGEYEDREILSGYTCDLLSHVMGKGQADMAWITVQAHMNVIAVAALLDFACVIIPDGCDCALLQYEGYEILPGKRRLPGGNLRGRWWGRQRAETACLRQRKPGAPHAGWADTPPPHPQGPFPSRCDTAYRPWQDRARPAERS